MLAKCQICSVDGENTVFIADKGGQVCIRCHAARISFRERVKVVMSYSTKWIGLSLLFLAAAALIAFGVAFAFLTTPRPGKHPWLALPVLALMGTALAWVGVRTAKRRLFPLRKSSRTRPWEAEIAALWDEAIAEGSVSRTQLLMLDVEIGGLTKARKFREALAKLESAIATAGANPLLRYLQATILIQGEQFNEAEALVDRLLQTHSLGNAARSLLRQLQMTVILTQGDVARARYKLDELLNSPVTPEEKIAALDQIACLPIIEGKREFLPDAMEFAKRALKLDPTRLTLQGTVASLMFEQGHTAEAVDILRAVYERSPSQVDQGICAFYLALAEKKKGNLRLARRFASEAQQLHPEPWLVERVRKELSESDMGSSSRS